MKRLKSILLVVTLLVLLVFATGCGINQNLGASMLETNEMEELETEALEDFDDQEEQMDQDEEAQISQTEEEQTDQEETDRDEEDQITDDRVVTVILNTNKDRKRIHLDNRSCSNKIKENNRQEWTGTADELIEYAKKYGYVACGSCHPERELDIDLPTK